MSDIIPDDQVALDAPVPAASNAAALPPSGPIPDEEVFLDSDKYNTLVEQLKTGAEGLAQGYLPGIATLAETHLLGVDPKDIAGRQEANPWIHGIGQAAGLGAGLLSGTGEVGLIARGAEGVAGAAKLGKLGSTVLKGALEAGIFQGGNEIDKAALGEGDPEAPVSSALAHMGAAALLGGGIGGALGVVGAGASKALKGISETKMGQRAAQFLEDFGNKWKFNRENPDLLNSIQGELSDFHNSTMGAADDVYGPGGLKDEAIQKLVPPMNENISGQNQKIAEGLQNKLAEMIKDPDTYPPRFSKIFMGDINEWAQTANNPNASSGEVFNATQKLKQKLQFYAKFDKQINPFAPERGFIDTAKAAAFDLRNALEDQSVWGKAGEIQQGVNKAFTDFKEPLANFRSKFMTEVNGEKVIDPGKVNTYVKQLGKPNAEIKQQVMRNFVDAADEYRSKISDLYDANGLESPLAPSSLNAVRGTLNEDPPAGAKFADYLSKHGPESFSSFGSRVAQGAAGAGIGYKEGGVKGAVVGALAGQAAPYLEEMVGRPLTNAGVNVVLKALSSENPGGIIQALDHIGNIQKGNGAISNSLDALFKGSKIATQQIYSADESNKDREKLKKIMAQGGINTKIQQSQGGPQPASSAPLQSFAEGGEVMPANTTTQPQPGSGESSPQNGVANIFPSHNMMLQAAKTRISNYLGSLQPHTGFNKLPYDREIKNPEQERTYNKALDIANQPLSIFNHIQNGTMTPETLGHFSQMYPELHNHLTKKITEKVANNQLNKERPSYKVMRGLSQFLGAPLDSSMKPANILANQNVFMQPSPQSGAQKAKKGSAPLSKMSSLYKTPLEARQGEKQTKS